VDTRTGDVAASHGDGARAAQACHDVLLAMAGRVPDRALWRLRDWLAAGATVALRTAVPRTLVRHRVGVTDAERSALRTAVVGWGGSPRLVDAVLHLDEPPAVSAAFGPEGPRPGWDAVDLTLRAVATASPGVRELRRTWRRDAGAPARVVLVRVDDDGPDRIALTGACQRALRALGDADPRVEVLASSSSVTGYHEAAAAASELLWASDGRAGVGAPPPRPAPATGELVPHG
jgi:hypothetical protein